MNNAKLIKSLDDATSDLDVAYRQHCKGRTDEARETLLQCHTVRMSVYGGAMEVIAKMERFDNSFYELYGLLYGHTVPVNQPPQLSSEAQQ